MGALKYLALLGILATTLVNAQPGKEKKAIGIFNLVQFPNDVCAGSGTQSGTCYTAEECTTRNGVASGTCADGYGVCCVITLACGGSSAENCTYLTQTAATADCTYTICPRDSTINRIRLDLTMFQIASPVSPTTAEANGDAPASTQTKRAALGHCTVDTFSVTGAPTICGTNTGQHMIVDTDGTACVKASFSFGGDAGQTRSYNIKVLQYARSDVDGGGRPGCLQWFTGNTGTVSTFGWTGVTSTHLANQDYNVCVRKNVGNCFICWAATTTGSATASGSFGLSNGGSAAIAAKSGTGAACATSGTAAMLAANNPIDSGDFVFIQGGVAVTGAATTASATTATAAVGGGRFCGRFLNGANAATAQGTVCSRRTPFQLGVNTDGIEAANANGFAQAAANELADGANAGAFDGPLGTIGFQLSFSQLSC